MLLLYWKPTMLSSVCRIRLNDLPCFIFPGGVKPKKFPGSNLFQTSFISNKRSREAGGVGSEGSLLLAKSSSAAGLLPQKRGRKHCDADVAGTIHNARSPENPIFLDQEVEGSLKCISPVGPSSSGSSGAKLTENFIQQSSSLIVGHQGSSNVLDEIKNESDMKKEVQTCCGARG